MSFVFNKSKVFLTLATLVLSAVFVGGAFAQSGTSTIKGSVSDQTGAAVPGATVTISNPATGFSRTTTTGGNGNYQFPGVAPATYVLSVEAGNFKKAVNNNVQAPIDSTATINVQLEPGDISAVVDVTSNTIESLVNTQDATIGNTFVPKQIAGLPTDLRRVTDLLTLQPGVTREGYSAGARSDQTNVTLDGVDINDQQTGGRTSQFDLSQSTAIRLTAEAVKEFRITTTNPNANQGRSSGAQISLVTRGGTNQFHGAGYYFYRPTEFSANDFFNNKAGVERPSLARDVFGGAIGGPIVKDKLFFFYSYEGQRESSAGSSVNLVPLPSLGQGVFKFRANGPGCGPKSPDPRVANCSLNLVQLNAIFPQAGINPAALAVFANAASRYPANDATTGDGFNTAGYRFNSPSTIGENTHIARFDWNISNSQQLFARGNYQWDNSTVGGAFNDTPSTGNWSHPYGYVVGHNWTINSNMINNFRYGLTRISASGQGDSNANFVSFRTVFTPLNFSRTSSRVNPTVNITDDFIWIKGGHTFQFGGNVRLIENRRSSFGSAFDSAVTNGSFYQSAGTIIDDAVANAGYSNIEDGLTLRRTLASMIGRFSQYSANFTFDIDGSPLPPGSPADRIFATEEYDLYVQDKWKPFSNLTLTLGLRYGMSRPVYEKNGFQVRPDQPLGDFLDRRIASAAKGVPLNDLINFELAGPANNAPGMYSMDWNNFQPSVAAAWSPNFKGGFLGKLFGEQRQSTFRGGFRIVNDYFGQQLAVNFDQLSAIGFTASSNINAETYNITNNLAPLFTGFGQDIRSLPGIAAPTQVFSVPADESFAIQTSLDTDLVSPINYQWSFSYGRSLPKGMYVEANYVHRKARNLLGARDVMAINNIVDPISGMDWYTAAGILRDASIAGTSVANVQVLPFFENLFPSITFLGQPTSTQSLYQFIRPRTDWTGIQAFLDDQDTPNIFYHPQYGALSAFGTIARSDYHGGTLSVRQRLGDWLSYDFNYTYSKSMDDVSGLQTAASFGSGFILNPIRQEDSYSLSDFDSTHVVNANFVVQLPFGRGQMFDDLGTTTDFFIGGWQLGGIVRFNTGRPYDGIFDSDGWDTNWNITSRGVRIAPIQSSPTRTGDSPNLFGDLDALAKAIRGPAPGETGDRNAFRDTGYSVLDMSLQKTFRFPWNENHALQFRWEVFNVLNQQYLAGTRGVQVSEGAGGAVSFNSGAGLFTGTRGNPRRMQFGLRFEF